MDRLLESISEDLVLIESESADSDVITREIESIESLRDPTAVSSPFGDTAVVARYNHLSDTSLDEISALLEPSVTDVEVSHEPVQVLRSEGYDPDALKEKLKAQLPDADDLHTKFMKSLPGVVIAVWVTIQLVLEQAADVPGWLDWGAFFAVGILAPVSMIAVTRTRWLEMPLLNDRVRLCQIGFALLSFVVWAYSLGGPFERTGAVPYDPLVGAVVLFIYTGFMIAILEIVTFFYDESTEDPFATVDRDDSPTT
ncbi:hypothetical protein EA473_04160 [Natrarchaeobius chitinivorans]|uniref:Uncharacterized protein n=1 Tax=Natrarchaeobius chitinivorans TaxID=1679083 RepID=A0A3N6M5D3_NATCH|nr:hypothetical protein EA473_04160 [Natrarchaeobius chitinivorans]